MKLERRFISQGELRVKGDGNGKKIAGYATKFTPSISEDLGFFREQIDPHAFDECLAANPDVRGLFNHDPNQVLGRTTAGTLRLSTDSVGLMYEIDPPATTLANDLMVSMERGDITQSSFGFICIEDTWREGVNGEYIRTVLKAELFDVSPVTFPAYADATSGVRAVRSLFPDGNEEIESKLAELRAAKIQENVVAEAIVPVVEAIVAAPSEETRTELVIDAVVISTEDATLVATTELRDMGDEDECECQCQSCIDGNCGDCTNPDCDDEDCEECSMRSARIDAETRAAADELETLQLRLALHQRRKV